MEEERVLQDVAHTRLRGGKYEAGMWNKSDRKVYYEAYFPHILSELPLLRLIILCPEKMEPLYFVPNAGQFSKFFHQQTLQ